MSQTLEKNPPHHSPNSLTGLAAAANAVIDYTDPANPVCNAALVQGAGTAECAYVNDPLGPYVVLEIQCPPGQTSLQNGCVSGGSEAVTAVIQQIGTVQCFINAPIPANPGWISSVTSTCVDLSITSSVSGKALVSTLLKPSAMTSRAQAIASFAKGG